MTRRRNPPFRLLARFYDEFLDGIPPVLNRHAREKILGPHWRELHSACDVACGNGDTAIDLARRGLRVDAVDLSPVFVREARARARAAGVRMRVQRADMRRFKLRAPVDLVLCEFSALNHLETRGDLVTAFRAVARALRPGGLYLVDVNTPRSFAKQYVETMFLEKPRFKVVLRNRREDRGRRVCTTFEWFVRAPRGDSWRHVRESYWSVCWTLAEFRRALRKAGLRLLKTFDGVDVRPPIEGAGRGFDLYLLSRKPSKR